jgi:hypothetical protein
MTSSAPRLLIVDQSLRDMAGHHYEYDVALFRAAAAAGIQVIVGAHASVQALDLLGDNVRPWFQRAWYEAPRIPVTDPRKPVLAWLPSRVRAPLARLARRIIGPRTHAAAPAPAGMGFGWEVLALIRAERFGVNDHVLVHTFGIPELDALIELARTHDDVPLIHVIFRRDAEEPSVADGPDGGVRGSFMRIASSPSAVAIMRLYADTEALARQYGALAPGLDIGVIPIPHCLPDDPSESSRADGPLRIVYLGDARGEKGFHLLPDLVDALADNFLRSLRARFVLQGNISVAGDNEVLSAARQRLAAYPDEHVELITEQLDVPAFHTLVRSADIVLLPYDAQAYARRSSGILVQALAAGQVVVAPSGTWLASQADPAASVLFDGEAGLAAAVTQAIERWPSLSEAARAGSAAFRAQHDASRYIAQLLRAGNKRNELKASVR